MQNGLIITLIIASIFNTFVSALQLWFWIGAIRYEKAALKNANPPPRWTVGVPKEPNQNSKQ